MKVYLVSDKKDVSYEVLKYDEKTQDATLKGKYAIITMKLDIQFLKKAGYKLIKETQDA